MVVGKRFGCLAIDLPKDFLGYDMAIAKQTLAIACGPESAVFLYKVLTKVAYDNLNGVCNQYFLPTCDRSCKNLLC